MTTPAQTTVGQFTVPATAGVQVAAAQIATSTQTTSEAAGIVPALRQATVVSNNGGTPPTCTVTFDGTTNVAGIGYVYPLYPQAGNVVYCFVLGGQSWICQILSATAGDPIAAAVTSGVTSGINASNHFIINDASGTYTMMMRPGGYSGTTGTDGWLNNISHGATFTPNQMLVSLTNPGGGSQGYILGVGNITSSTFSIRFNAASALPVAGGCLALGWT